MNKRRRPPPSRRSDHCPSGGTFAVKNKSTFVPEKEVEFVGHPGSSSSQVTHMNQDGDLGTNQNNAKGSGNLATMADF